MAKICQEAQFDRYLTDELARFVNGILVCRRKAFSSMSNGGPLSLLSCALDVLGDGPVQSVMNICIFFLGFNCFWSPLTHGSPEGQLLLVTSNARDAFFKCVY